jgi:23S rRNA (uridine2552-2'-O)-methyltransferase
MAPNTIGHHKTDHLRIIDLCERSFYFAIDILKPGGHFIAKILRGGTENTLLNETKKRFTEVKHFKPESSRKESREIYLVAMKLR